MIIDFHCLTEQSEGLLVSDMFTEVVTTGHTQTTDMITGSATSVIEMEDSSYRKEGRDDWCN